MYIYLSLTRGIDFLLAELWKRHPEEDVMNDIPSWLLPYLDGVSPLSDSSTTMKSDSQYTKMLAYYKDTIENYLAKELLI